MRKLQFILLLLIFGSTSLALRAQFSNVVVFTQAAEPFLVVINGIQQSPDPETNVKITGLNAPSYKVKIIFSNKALPEIDKTIYLEPETEVTYEVLKNSKGNWVMRMLNTTPVDEAPETRAGQDVFIYTTTPRLSTTVTTTSQTTTISTGIMPVGATITTTTTQTTSESTHHDELPPEEMWEGRPDYRGPCGCPRPMNKKSFDQALSSIDSKNFESSKLTVAKQIVGANCLTCNQVKEIMQLLTFESDKLEFAKFAYKYTWDLNNFYLLNDAFEFESSIDELNRYVNGRRP